MMSTVIYGVVAIILLAVVEHLVALLLEKVLPNVSGWRHVIALIVAMVVLAVVAVLLQNNLGSSTPTPEPGLLYQLTVQDADTREPIEGAVAVLTVRGVSPFRDTTDADGLAAIDDLPDGVVGETAVLTINAEGYAPYRLNVAVNLNQLPDLISLTKQE